MGTEIKTSDRAKSFACGWMKTRGYEPSESLPCPDDFSFMVQGKAVNDIPFLIIQPKIADNFIVVIANVRVTESSFASLKGMNEADREEFLWNLKKDLMFAPPNFSFDPSYEETGIPKGFQFSKDVYYDELTEGKLAEVVDYTVRSALWVIWSFRRKFGAPKEVKFVD